MNNPVNLLPLMVLFGTSMSTNISHAQTYQPSNRAPIADNSLGTKVLTNNNNFTITGGASRGQNTFHSFQDFSVPTNGTATFVNPIGNQGIITRVTGNLFSDINGTVNTQGANFLLINPNGIVFGPSTQLNVGRVFAASTGNGVDLVDGAGKLLTFGVNSIGDAPLLAIDPQVVFNVSRLNTGVNNGEIKNFGTLQTNNSNQFIGFLGGNISLEGGKIFAFGGRVELGSLAAVGAVEVDNRENRPSWNFPVNVDRGNILLRNQSGVNVLNVRNADKGDIVVNAQNLNLSDGSYMAAGIAVGNGSSITGDIKVVATGKVSLDSNSYILNLTTSGAGGTGGNINIKANSFSLTDNSNITIDNKGSGNAGDLTLKVKDDIVFKDSRITNMINGIGKSGGINISAKSFSLYNSRITSSNTGKDLQSNIEINVKDTFSLLNSFVAVGSTNESVDNNSLGGNINVNSGSVILDKSAIYSEANKPVSAGDISITSRSLTLKDDSQIGNFSINGKRGGGNIKLNVTDVISISGSGSGILSELEAANVGNSGDIDIDTNSLFLQDKARISSINFGLGNSGKLTVKSSGAITLTGESIITTTARGSGNTGGIAINAGALFLDNSLVSSSNSASGNSGDISIKVSDQVNIAGPLTRSVFFGGGILSLVSGSSAIDNFGGSNGNSGNITIMAKSISSNNAAGIANSNFGTGKVGEIKLAATDFISLSGMGIISVNSLGEKAEGSSGNITINSPRVVLNDKFQITSTSSAKDGGNINISTLPANESGTNQLSIANSTASLLFLRNGSKIITNAESQEGGSGGNININSNFVIAAPNENSDITATSVRDRGGKVNINSLGLFGIEQRPQLSSRSDITASSDFGQSGSVNISTLGNEPRKNTTELTTAPIDVSSQITQVCNPNQVGNQLHVTGRGGHPVNTEELLTNDVVWIDPRNSKNQSLASNLIAQSSKKIAQPATGWTFNSRGQVTLLASNTEIDTTKSKVTCPTK